MKRNLFNAAFVIVWIVVLALVMDGVILIVTDAAKADEIEVVDIIPTEPVPKLYEILATHEPKNTPAVKDENIPPYSMNQDSVNRISRLLWSSPLRSEEQKKKLVWVVLNRIDDDSGVFGNTVDTVVIAKEFSFFDKRAHLSDKNDRIVKEIMQLWLAEKDGYKIGRRPSKNALYIRFEGDSNRYLAVTAVPGGAELEW